MITLEDAIEQRKYWRSQKHRVAFTNGCFDILHPGHYHLLVSIKARSTKLIVGLNSDASVRRLKGPSRPVNDVYTRAHNLLKLKTVDKVVVFDEDTPYQLIRSLRPDVLAKGGDYTADTIVGADLVRAYQGSVFIVPYLAGHSTTAIIEEGRVR